MTDIDEVVTAQAEVDQWLALSRRSVGAVLAGEAFALSIPRGEE